jgi:hypothetical protein
MTWTGNEDFSNLFTRPKGFSMPLPQSPPVTPPTNSPEASLQELLEMLDALRVQCHELAGSMFTTAESQVAGVQRLEDAISNLRANVAERENA